MRKFLLHSLLLMTLLTALVFSANAAETACGNDPLGTYNGQPACMRGSFLHACKNNFPDDNFRKYLQNHLHVKNGLILTEASDMPIVFHVPEDISDLTGIEFFPNLQTLYISHNRVTTLDLSKNTTLTNVSCTRTQLTSINLSNLSNLTHLDCSNNYLTDLDLTSCPALNRLNCNNNQLTTLDISGNSQLQTLFCTGNALTSLVLPAQSSLTNASLGTQTLPTITNSSATITLDLKALLGSEHLDRIHGISFDRSTGIANIAADSLDSKSILSFDYLVPTVNGQEAMEIQIKVLCNHKYTYGNPFANGTCDYCGISGPPYLPIDSITFMMLVSLGVCILFLCAVTVFIRNYRKAKTY